MTLHEICEEIAEITAKLMYGEITFEYDNLMCAMKPGHPADILDDILAIIGWDVFAGKTPEKEKVEEMYAELKEFNAALKVKELKKPISDLENYLYPKTILTFPIYIEESGESFVEFPVSEKEIKKLQKAIDDGYDFEEAPGLKTFYNKLMRAAKKKLKEDVDLTFDDIDVNDLDYCVDYPEDLEEVE